MSVSQLFNHKRQKKLEDSVEKKVQNSPKLSEKEPTNQVQTDNDTLEKCEKHTVISVGFRPPDLETFKTSQDDKLLVATDFPHLTPIDGQAWDNTPLQIHGMKICCKTFQILYLCSW